TEAVLIEQLRLVADRKEGDLLGGKPEWEVAGVMFDQEADETFVGAERGAMNAERRLLGVVAIFVNEAEISRLRRVDLVGGDGEFAADGAPDLNVDLRTVERGFVRDLNVVD